MRRRRRAKKFGCDTVVDRWDNDATDDYKFRKNLEKEGWTRDVILEVDRIANSEGKPQPKAGEGRSAAERARHEGLCQLVSQSGAQPEVARDPARIPAYVMQRHARRKA